jgi:hypothetical protein
MPDLAAPQFYFDCPNDGPQEDGLGNGHGACPICGAELVRRPVPAFPPPVPDGIARHWAEEAAAIDSLIPGNYMFADAHPGPGHVPLSDETYEAAELVGAAGFEPATAGLEGRCSDPSELRPHSQDSIPTKGGLSVTRAQPQQTSAPASSGDGAEVLAPQASGPQEADCG